MHTAIISKKTGKVHILVVSCLLVVLSLACNLPFFSQGGTSQENHSIKEGLVQDVPIEPYSRDLPEHLLSGVQRQLVSEYGYPDRFIIQFFDLNSNSGEEVTIREESWYYDEMGYEIVFRNGEKFTEQITDPVIAPGLQSTAYQPERFIRGMSLLDVLSITGESGYYAESMPSTFFEDGKIVFLKGLSIGFENERLRYVETIPLGNAGISSQNKQLAFVPTQTPNGATPPAKENEGLGTGQAETTSAPPTENSPTPEGTQVALLPGNVLGYSQSPELIVYADNQSGSVPAEVQLAPFCQTGCFRYQGWLGLMKPGDSYEVIFKEPTTTVGVQFWGDPGDGIAHVYLDGEKVWEGSTEGTDVNYPGGAFVHYLQISNLPAIANHILRIETDAGGGAVTMYFFGSGLATP